MIDQSRPLTDRTLLRFYLPLVATWLMMAVEGPFLAALIARLADPKINLAAYGVVMSLGWIVEAPVILMLSASNALVRDKLAFLKLRRFAMRLNVAVTAVMLLLVVPPVFDLVARRWIALPPDVAEMAGRAIFFMIVWPGAIGFRRFYQGILIREGRPQAVTAGTVIRLTTMAAAGLGLGLGLMLPGALVGAGALGAGVFGEAAASWIMARRPVRRLLAQTDEICAYGRNLTSGKIWQFYAPMALMSFLALAIYPMTTFFMSRSRYPLESLAVIPVMGALVFLFRTPGIAYQEVVIALLGDNFENHARLKRFAKIVAACAAGALALVAYSPLAMIWLRDVSGLSPELARFALVPLRILFILPATEVFLAFMRGHLVKAGRTWPLVGGVAAQIAAVLGTLLLTVGPLRFVGATAAAIAQLAGYAVGTVILGFSVGRVVRDIRAAGTPDAPEGISEPLAETVR
jgi:progressive ankylosis protein